MSNSTPPIDSDGGPKAAIVDSIQAKGSSHAALRNLIYKGIVDELQKVTNPDFHPKVKADETNILRLLLTKIYRINFLTSIQREKNHNNPVELGEEIVSKQEGNPENVNEPKTKRVQKTPVKQNPTQVEYKILITNILLEICSENNLPIKYLNGSIRVFNGMYWQKIEKDKFKSFLKHVSSKAGVPWSIAQDSDFLKKLLEQFEVIAYFPVPAKDTTRVLINCRNGTLQFDNGKPILRKHDPGDYLNYVLGFAYDPTAKCPEFLSFLSLVLPDLECQKVLQEYLGYVLAPTEILKLQKFLILQGPGANGKSVVFDIVYGLLGKENVTAFSLTELSDKSGYYRIQIEDKLLNYSTEIGSSKVDIDYLKKMVSGEPLPARTLYQEPRILYNYSKFWFNCNELPKRVEHSDAYHNRSLILPFHVKIRLENQDPHLAKRIIQTDLPGIFNWAIEGLVRLIANEKFTHSRAVQTARNEYKKETDPVWLFLEDSNYVPDTRDCVPVSELFNEFCGFLEEYKLPPMSLPDFGKHLNGYGFQKKRTNRQTFYFLIKKAETSQ